MSSTRSNDKRRFIRYEVLDYAVVTGEGREPINAVIVDIGLGGLQIRSKETLEIGILCRLSIGRLNAEPLSIAGEVRHSGAVDGSDLMATGIRFCPSSHDDRMAIAEYVHGVFQRQCDKLLV